MKKITILFLFSPFLILAQKPIFTTAKAKAATVYYNSAEISQNTAVFLPQGSSEIVIKNVADAVNENSIRIAAPSHVTILSVQFTNNYINEYEIDENSPEIKKVQDSIQYIEKEINKLSNALNSEAKTLELLDKNQQVSGTNSGLNLSELAKVVEYYKAKRTEISNNYDALEEKIKTFKQQILQLKNKLEINTKNEEKTSKGKLILQLMNEIAGNTNLDIQYLTPNASWKPFYDLRTNSISEPLKVVYKAEVLQKTGIDWKQVKLTLSSGNPSQSNQAPTLYSWFLRYRDEFNDYNAYRGDSNATHNLQGQVAGLTVSTGSGQPGADSTIILRGVGSIHGNTEPLFIVDGVPVDEEAFRMINQKAIKTINVLKDASATSIYGNRGANGVVVITTKKGLDDYTFIEEKELSVSFDIDIPYDILSNGKAHSVSMKQLELPATYQYYVAPRIDREAFLLANISNYGQYNLLPGQANIIFEDLYTGRIALNPGQTSDTLKLSMGRDKKISIEREKIMDKSGVKFLSSKKEQDFTYEITVRNNKKEAISLKLEDQYPLSTDKNVEITLKESNGANVDEETGILTWKLNLKPNETRKVRMSYKIRYPKDRMIDNL